jgi:transposase InsO family protein
VWQYNFANFSEGRTAITQWIEWYNAEGTYQALGYRSPR